MEGEAVAQVAPPIFIHQSLPGRFCESSPVTKKRDLPWANPSWQQQQQQHQIAAAAAGYQNAMRNWNPKLWDWDSVMFAAKPQEAGDLHNGKATIDSDQRKVVEETQKPLLLKKSSVDEDAESLTLKLGGSSYSADESVARSNKRVRAGSPGNNYPKCQVDDCRADLSNAKDYHRRHKVCELHSKTTKALVGKQMQRFCQQCSRFHPLKEFDEGKRSCRRRLAGHNRRRRKTQPDDVSSRLLLPGNQDNGACGNLDLVNLITILAQLQGNNGDKACNVPSLPDRECLLQILSKINPLPVSENNSARVPVQRSLNLNFSQTSQASSDHQSMANGKPPLPSTVNLLPVLSAALAASLPDALPFLSQGSNSSNDDSKVRPQHPPAKLNCREQAAPCNLQSKTSLLTPYTGAERGADFQTPDISQSPVQTTRTSIPLQLFSSSPDDESPSKLGSSRNYFSSDSSNPMDEISPSSSPPLVQKLFPLHSTKEITKDDRMSTYREDDLITVEASPSHGWSSSLDLFKRSPGGAENGINSNISYRGLESRSPVIHADYTSSSGSDHSPSSSNSDSQDRTRRIVFKLFGKDPSNFPVSLRTQILNWLKHSPSEMESYIRPGCVVLSVYVSMPSSAWDQLEEDLLQRVGTLVNNSDSEFWRSGRFLVHTDKQLVSHKDGKIRLCKSWETWNAPELILVSPLAVVGGQETSLVLRGHNLTVPGTKIHCTCMGGYTSKEIPGAGISGCMYEEPGSGSFCFHGGAPNVLGRCFIEVENGFKGNSFPVLIADAAICRELRILESEFEDDARLAGNVSEDQVQEFRRPNSREDALHFLNELGWLFQKKNTRIKPNNLDFSHFRFKFLFTFSVERDWSALVKTLLDIFVEINSGRDGLLRESLEVLSEIHLLNRAVKRKCRKMVDLLLHYSLCGTPDVPKKYLFTPNLAGPGGLTPLHLAAATQNSEDLVAALTNDPQGIGLNSWSSIVDSNGQSPYSYALMRNNHSYNRLVRRKLAERRSGQISISVADAGSSLEQSWKVAEPANKQRSLQHRECTQCATELSRRARRIPGTQGFLHRPYVRSMLAIAAVCVCVCILFRGSPQIGSIDPFKWENILFGTE